MRRLTSIAGQGWCAFRGVFADDRKLRLAAITGGVYTVTFLALAITLPDSSLAGRLLSEIVYPIPEAAAAVVLLLAGRRSTWAPWFWYLLAAATFAGLVGDVNWAVYDFLLGQPPIPSAGDIAYTAQPVLMIAAVLAAFPLARPRLGDVADLAVPFAAFMFVTYDVVIEPQLAGGLSAATIPSIVEMLVTLLAALLFTTAVCGVRGVAPAVKLAYAGVLVAAASYPLYSYAISLSTWQHINWLYAGFQASFWLLILGGYERIRRGEPAMKPARADTDVNVWLITGGLMLVLGAIVVTMNHGRMDTEAPWVGMVSITVVLVRMHQIVRHRSRLAALLNRLATTDSLTEIANRRAFDDRLAHVITTAHDAGGSAGLLIFDLDHFKAVNDRYGHPAGDEVLAGVARRIRRVIRTGDTLARIGGEEFAVIAPDATAEELTALAERCRLAVCADPFAIGEQRITMTTSVGASHYPSDADGRETLVQLADRALYQAKRTGRNRVWAGGGDMIETPLATVDMTALRFLERLADQLNVEHGEQDRALTLRLLVGDLADQLGVDPVQRRRCLLAARLHDIGKVGVPAELLAKAEPLTAAERLILHEHVRIGVDLLRRCDETAEIAPIIGELRERPDGLGYPHHKTGEEISLEARIIAVADAWTAMLADRPYRAALTADQARRQLLAGRASQFDERVVDAVIHLLDQKPAGRRAA